MADRRGRSATSPEGRTATHAGRQQTWMVMLGRFSSMLFLAVATSLLVEDAAPGNELHNDTSSLAPIVEGAPTLAPFRHVRFCLRYPSDCQPNSRNDQRIFVNRRVMSLLTSVNSRINRSIVPSWKEYRGNLDVRWVIAPSMGDCNDYAVTKRHELLMSGLPSSALRLTVVKTPNPNRASRPRRCNE